MKKSSNWKLLPSEVVQLILQYLDVDDAQNVLTTCKEWYSEADYYLKDKVWLCINKTDSLKDMKSCKRRFEHTKTNKVSPTDLRLIKALTRRDVKYANKITTAFIRYDNLSRLVVTVEEIGNHLNSLTLHNQCSNFNKRKRSIADGKDVDNIGTKNFCSVQELRIDCLNNSILPISKSFVNLKYLELFSVTSEQALENFIMSNPCLEHLNMKYITFHNKESFMFQNLGNLRKFITHDENFALTIVKQKLSLHTLDITCMFSDEICSNIRNNFIDIKELNVRATASSFYTEKGLNDILKISNLTSFSYKGRFCPEAWTQSFKAPNTSITKLALEGRNLVEDIVIACIQNLPNITNFEVYDISAPSFRYIQEMAENFKQLEFLGVSLVEEMSFGRLLKFKPWKTPAFEKLTELKLRSNFESPTDLFFKYFKAPALVDISFDLSACSDSNEVTFITNMRKVMKLILRNSPNAEIILDTEQLQNDMARMREIIFHARSL